MDDSERETNDQLRKTLVELRAENDRLHQEIRWLRSQATPKELRARKRSVSQLAFAFLAGLVYLGFVAALLSGVTRVGFVPMFLAVLAGAVFCTSLALVWLTRWALREESRPRQFSLSSLLFLTTFVAIYFAVVRWLVVNSWPPGVAQPPDGEKFLMVGTACIVLAAISIPCLLGMANSLVWFAVWLVRRPSVRRWLARRRRSGGE